MPGRRITDPAAAVPSYSLWTGDTDPTAAQDGERAVRESVSAAPYGCFSGG
ncbi:MULTISPECIES: hypothetical protein [unclassified Streptomyces]|uniref:hypothetical protein n=1 Tax=unclassified Streptomyces TaxID=2593676 RepID=UPI0035E20AB8